MERENELFTKFAGIFSKESTIGKIVGIREIPVRAFPSAMSVDDYVKATFFNGDCKSCPLHRGPICESAQCPRNPPTQNSITSEQARQLRQRERQELLGKTKEELVDMILGKEYNIY